MTVSSLKGISYIITVEIFRHNRWWTSIIIKNILTVTEKHLVFLCYNANGSAKLTQKPGKCFSHSMQYKNIYMYTCLNLHA